MKSFLEYILEQNNVNLSEAGAASDPTKNDSHEIMTACLCTLSLDDLIKLQKITGKENILKELEKLKKIAQNSKIIIGASESDIQSIIQYSKKEEAFAQAISAAIKIVQYNNISNSNKAFNEAENDTTIIKNKKSKNIDKVILTGKSWSSDVAKYSGIENLKKLFDVESYGMKDFNSSDIILVSGKKYLGVSLKKKKAGKQVADPPIINRSFIDTLPEEAKKHIQIALDKTFNEILKTQYDKLIVADDVIPAILNKLPKMKSKLYAKFITSQEIDDILNPNNSDPSLKLIAFLKDKCKKSSGDMWKEILSPSYGLMCTHNSREHIRTIINPILSSATSEYKKNITTVLNNKDIANNIAIQLFAIIFKADISHGLMNLKKYDFDFGLCTGQGSYSPSKQTMTVSEGEFEDIETVTTILQDLRTFGKPNLIPIESTGMYVKDNDTSVSLKYKLNIGTFPIADIIIRYKGNYNSSPTFLATMSLELKKKFIDAHNNQINAT